MLIEPAVPADVTVLTAIAHAAKRHWGYPEAWIRQWATTLTLTPDYLARHAVFVARERDKVVGFCALTLEQRPAGTRALHETGDTQLDHLWVLPAAMGRGIGRVLFTHAQQHARQLGARRLWVESDPHAEDFYRHMGLTVFGRQPAPMDGQERFLPLMEMRLDTHSPSS